MRKDTIILGAIVVVMAILLIAANVPATPTEFTGNITITGNLNVTGTSEFGGNVNMSGNYILYLPLENWIHVNMSAGATNVQIFSVPVGTYNQNRHYAKLHASLDTAPGVDKFVNVTLSDGTNSLTVSIGGTDTFGASTTTAFDLDVSAEMLSLKYNQTAGGESSEACIMFHWWYKETP